MRKLEPRPVDDMDTTPDPPVLSNAHRTRHPDPVTVAPSTSDEQGVYSVRHFAPTDFLSPATMPAAVQGTGRPLAVPRNVEEGDVELPSEPDADVHRDSSAVADSVDVVAHPDGGDVPQVSVTRAEERPSSRRVPPQSVVELEQLLKRLREQKVTGGDLRT